MTYAKKNSELSKSSEYEDSYCRHFRNPGPQIRRDRKIYGA